MFVFFLMYYYLLYFLLFGKVSGQVSVTTLTLNQATNGVLPSQSSPSNAYIPAYYQVLIPQDTISVSISVSTGPEVYIEPWVSTGGLPCSTFLYNATYLCNSRSFIASLTSYDLEIAPSVTGLQWRVGDYWYIAIMRATYNSEGLNSYDQTIDFSITVTVQECGSDFEIAVADDNTYTIDCVRLDYYSVIGYARDIETTTGEKFIAMKVDNPPTTYIPNITVSLNLDTNELNGIYLNYRAPALEQGWGESYPCSYVIDGVGTGSYTFTCGGPPSGPYYSSIDYSIYFELYNSAEINFSGTYQIDYGAPCPSGSTGPSCTDVPINTANFPYVTVDGPQISVNGNWADSYLFTFNPNSNQMIVFTVNVVQGSGILMYRAYGYPLPYTFIVQNTCGLNAGGSCTFILMPQDIYEGGNYYFSVYNENSSPLVYTLTGSSVSTVTYTTAQQTTAQQTTQQQTTVQQSQHTTAQQTTQQQTTEQEFTTVQQYTTEEIVTTAQQTTQQQTTAQPGGGGGGGGQHVSTGETSIPLNFLTFLCVFLFVLVCK